MHTNGQETHEKMFNVANHQGNVNQNHNEISPHTYQDRYYQKDKKKHVGEDVEKGVELPYDSAIPLLGIYLKEIETLPQKYMHPYVHCSIIYNSQDMKTT